MLGTFLSNSSADSSSELPQGSEERSVSPRAIDTLHWHAPYKSFYSGGCRLRNICCLSLRLFSLPNISSTIREMRHLFKVFGYLVPVFALAALMLLMNTTDPISAGPGGILVVFLLVYIFWAGLFFTILHLGLGVVSRLIIRHRKAVTVRSVQLSIRKAYYIASALAFVPVLLLAMNSLGQLQIRDVALVSIFMFLVIFYIVKRT